MEGFRVGPGGSNPPPFPCRGGTKVQVRFERLIRCAREYRSLPLSASTLLRAGIRDSRLGSRKRRGGETILRPKGNAGERVASPLPRVQGAI